MYNLSHYNVILATVFIGTITIFVYLYRRRGRNAIPEVWEAIGHVKSLYMYPLKSGRRLELQTAECTEYGLKLATDEAPQLRDRCLVVYKESDREFRTARTYPNLLLVAVNATDKESFIVTAPNMETLRLKVPKLEKENVGEVYMWFKEKVFTIDCGDEAARWFSQFLLGKPSGLRLGFHDGQHKRDISGYHKGYALVYPVSKVVSGAMYSDLTTILLIGQASIEDLKSRIPSSNLSMNNFRPNIVIEGDKIKPYAEDNFTWLKIGDSIFRYIKLCTRCSVPTIDPDTAVKSTDYEPIKTLKTYRTMFSVSKNITEANEPVFGINMGIVTFGKINVGDTVYLGK